ncbi:hypothetical protein [Entomomonas asaccharolytica]|uniref:Uncharacterized protein n=1 Tax=Entomomonas asaccharolytica TaxID=2785331 RepID=A0A974NDD4_9GAMM|nr:hypothetical protein [Entomomonas asaccharolytica]QQP84535.1 hypothetical protein JHT90_08920 [Entomomonas asaccharolytica]
MSGSYRFMDYSSPFQGSALSPITNTACEENVLIIQVMGTNHPEGQEVIITNNRGQELSSTKDEKNTRSRRGGKRFNKNDIEIIQGENKLTSTLHSWSWQNQQEEERGLSLKIHTTNGNPILLPFAQEIGKTCRQEDGQINQIIPIVPLVWMGTASNNKKFPVLVRPGGYLYIFYKGKLWREIRVVQNENDETVYKDVNVSLYRLRDGSFRSGDREVIGVELKEIWLPRQYGTKNAYNVSMEYSIQYSEVQLSAARLAIRESSLNNDSLHSSPQISYQSFFEKYNYRSESNLRISQIIKEANYPIDNVSSEFRKLENWLITDIFPINFIPEQKQRNIQVEWELDYPNKYLYDIEGSYLTQSFANARNFNTNSINGVYNLTLAKDLELSAWKVLFTDTVNEKLQEKKEVDNNLRQFWAKNIIETDVLLNAKEREIYGVIIEDPYYTIRHLVGRVEVCNELMDLALEYLKYIPYSDSAILMQTFVSPHLSRTQISSQTARNISKDSVAPQREIIRERLCQIIFMLFDELSKEKTIEIWADHLSLDNNVLYCAAYSHLCTVISTLEIGIKTYRKDTITTNTEILYQNIDFSVNNTKTLVDAVAEAKEVRAEVDRVIVRGDRFIIILDFILELSNDNTNRYHHFLWPTINDNEVKLTEKLSVNSIAERANDGTGVYRIDCCVKEFINDQSQKTIKQDSSLDIALLIDNIENQDIDSTPTSIDTKIILKVLQRISKSLVSTIEGAYTNHLKTRIAMIESQRAMSRATGEVVTDIANAQTARDNLLNKGNIRVVRLHGLDLPLLQAQNFELMRTVNGNNPLGEIYLGRAIRTGTGITPYDGEGHNSRVLIFSAEGVNTNGIRRGYMDLLNRSNNNTRASTNLRNIPNNSVASNTSFIAVFYPRNSQLSRLIDTEHEARRSLLNSLRRQNIANLGLQEAITLRNQAFTMYTNRLRFLNLSRGISSTLIIFETIGLINELTKLEQEVQRNGNQAYWKLAVTISNLVFAGEELSYLFSGRNSLSAQLRLKPNGFALRRSTSYLSRNSLIGKTNIPGLTFLKGPFAMIGLVLSYLDLKKSFIWHNDPRATFGYGLIAAAGVVSILALLGVSSGPLGWTALALTVIGGVLIAKFSHSELQKWIANGPFASNDNEQTHFLKDPVTAYHYLLNILSDITIKITEDKNGINPLTKTTIEVTSNIPFSVLGGEEAINIGYQYVRVVTRDGIRISQSIIREYKPEISEENKIIVFGGHELVSESRELYSPATISTTTTIETKWIVRAQFKLHYKGRQLTFPLPEIDSYARQHTVPSLTPDFTRVGVPYWADEETNKPRSNN